jgi:hypothetical protein
MLEKQLEEILEKYLQDNNREYYENSINYVSLRNIKTIDGETKKVHIVSFMVSISNQPYDGDAFYSAAFDSKTKKLIFIIGPQSYEKINE